MHPRRETRSLDIRRQSFDRLDRRRSADLCRSTRRYDEFWGAAEKSDTRLKCGDGIIHHVHSQMCILWSPVLRDMINLYPTPALLESTHGLAYLLQVEEDSRTWAAVLDMMYPVHAQPAIDWDMLERCLVLADKYDMSCIVERISARLLEPAMAFSVDPSQPNFALRWLNLADRLQLPAVAACILDHLKCSFSGLGSQPEVMSAVLSYAQEHLSKEQLLQLLQISMLAQQQPKQQQQQQQPPAPEQAFMAMQAMQQQAFLQPQQLQQQQTISSALQGWLGQAQSSSSLGPMQQLQQQQGWRLPLFSQQQQQPAVSASCSGSSSPESESESLCDEACSDQAEPAGAAEPDSGNHRLAMCWSSGLFASAAPAQPQQPAPAAAAGAAAPTFVPAAPSVSKAAACPVPRFPASLPAFSAAAPVQHRQQQGVQFGLQAGMQHFGFGVNAGSTSIADWMCSQPEGMCLT